MDHEIGADSRSYGRRSISPVCCRNLSNLPGSLVLRDSAMSDAYRLRPDQPKKGPAAVPPAAAMARSAPIKPAAPPSNVPAATPTAGERQLLAERGKPRVESAARVVSLDAYRGFIMFVLAASGFGILQFARIESDQEIWNSHNREKWQRIAFHFDHPAWQSNFLPSSLEKADDPEYQPSGFLKFGVSFWDLIQPAFMFMVGVAMPFSYARRASSGHSAGRRFLHAVWRAKVLVLLGVFLYSLDSERTNWVFTNVLAQIGLGYLFAYLLLGWKPWIQLTALVAILAGYWLVFYLQPPPAEYNYAAVNASVEKGEVYEGKFAAWSKNANAAHWFDRQFLNRLRTLDADAMAKLNIEADATSWSPEFLRRWLFANDQPFTHERGGYQTLNFVPSIGTTLLGILCGQLLLSALGKWKKLGLLLAGGLLCLGLGLVAGEFACPIVKRIWTPSWVLFSGAYVIWMLAAFYFLCDVLPLKFFFFPLVVVGMNSIAIYLMGQLLRGWTMSEVVKTHLAGVLEWIMDLKGGIVPEGLGEQYQTYGAYALSDQAYGPLVYSTAAAVIFWLVAYWMYRQKYFVRV
jgi:predicted acyltransferase